MSLIIKPPEPSNLGHPLPCCQPMPAPYLHGGCCYLGYFQTLEEDGTKGAGDTTCDHFRIPFACQPIEEGESWGGKPGELATAGCWPDLTASAWITSAWNIALILLGQQPFILEDHGQRIQHLGHQNPKVAGSTSRSTILYTTPNLDGQTVKPAILDGFWRVKPTNFTPSELSRRSGSWSDAGALSRKSWNIRALMIFDVHPSCSWCLNSSYKPW